MSEEKRRLGFQPDDWNEMTAWKGHPPSHTTTAWKDHPPLPPSNLVPIRHSTLVIRHSHPASPCPLPVRDLRAYVFQPETRN